MKAAIVLRAAASGIGEKEIIIIIVIIIIIIIIVIVIVLINVIFSTRVNGSGENRWSGLLEAQGEARHVARMVVRDERPPKPYRAIGQDEGRKGMRSEAVERSSSRVTAKVTNLMRWPRKGTENEGAAKPKNSFV